jgi:hypothetical protein
MANIVQNLASNKWLPLIGAGMGMFGNFMQNRQYNGMMGRYMDMIDAYRKLTPAEVTKGILAMKQPLSLALRQSVGNATQGYLAERGLSQAPGIQASTLAQALAPYDQKLLDNAMQSFFQMKGLPMGVNLPIGMGNRPGAFNIDGLIQAMMDKWGRAGGSGGGSGSGGGLDFGLAEPFSW